MTFIDEDVSDYPQLTSVTTIPVSYPIELSMVLSVLLLVLAATAAVPMSVAGAVFVGMVAIIGPGAAVGGAAGVLVHDLFRGAVGYWTISLAVWVFVFAWLVAWLAPSPFYGRRRYQSASLSRVGPRYFGAVVIAGILSASSSAWVTMALDGQPFHLTASTLIASIPFTLVVGVPVLLLSLHRVGRDTTRPALGEASPTTETATPHGTGLDFGELGDPSASALVLLAIGLVWLGGAMALDLLAHDLSVFPTEQELIRYGTDMFGRDSMPAAIGIPTMVAIYRYGEFAVLLSAPIAALLWGLFKLTTASQEDGP